MPYFSFKSFYVTDTLLFCVVLCIQLAEMPDIVFRITLVGIAGGNFLLSLVIEVSMIRGVLSHFVIYVAFCNIVALIAIWNETLFLSSEQMTTT